MVDTRVLKYKENKFYPLTNLKSVIDENELTLEDILITSEKTGTIGNIDETLYTNALRKTEQHLEDFEKEQVEKNLGLNTKFSDIYSKLARAKDVLFDATELYEASISKLPINPTFRMNLLKSIEDGQVLFSSVSTNNSKTTAIITFVNKVNDIAYFVAYGRDFKYVLTLDLHYDTVESKRYEISVTFNKFVTENGNDIFHVTTNALNEDIQNMLTTDSSEVLLPSVGDVFESYETTPELGRILHYSGIVTSRVEVNSEQDIILFSNDLKDDFFMIHHIKLEYIKDKGVSSLKVLKAYHNIINPHDLDLNNRNIVFVNDVNNCIFNATEIATNKEVQAILTNKNDEVELPNVGDMFVAYQNNEERELEYSGVVVSVYDSQKGFIIKIVSNNILLDFWALHTIEFEYTPSVGYGSLRILNAHHVVIDPSLIEHSKMEELYANVERLTNNYTEFVNAVDNINGEII